LQDNIILDAVDRANTFIKLSPLMLYIAVHELIHVLRFENGAIDFNALQEEKEQEEKIVHKLTRSALQQIQQSDLEIVLDCFSSEFAIRDLCN
jgi:alpha-N-acetylglucosamine transferase